MLVRYGKGVPGEASAIAEAVQTASTLTFDQALMAIAPHADLYASLLGGMSDDDFRVETMGVDGSPTTRGAFMVNQVLGQCAAYRMQLFLYLKSCGREELNTMNLWLGTDAAWPPNS